MIIIVYLLLFLMTIHQSENEPSIVDMRRMEYLRFESISSLRSQTQLRVRKELLRGANKQRFPVAVANFRLQTNFHLDLDASNAADNDWRLTDVKRMPTSIKTILPIELNEANCILVN